MAFDVLKMPDSSKQSRPAQIEDTDGKLITDSDEVLERWTECCRDLDSYGLTAGVDLPEKEWRCRGGWWSNPQRRGGSVSMRRA